MVDTEMKRLAAGVFPSEEEKAKADKLRDSLLQPVCEGSLGFLSWCSCCCLLGLVAPIVLLVMYGGMVEKAQIFIIIGVVLLVAGLGTCCYGIWPLLTTKTPPPPPPLYPLCKAPRSAVPKKAVVLVNPMGGLKGSQGIFDEFVKPAFERAGIGIVVITTEYAGHAKVICHTRDFTGIDVVVVIGGDGTFHECVNGLMERMDKAPKPAIGLVPGGSGNSFMTGFAQHTDVASAVANITDGLLADIDVTRVEFGPDAATDPKQRAWSINLVAFCADHCMAAVNIDSYRASLGTRRYDVCALWGLLKGRSSNVDMLLNGELWASGVGALFANTTQYFGKGMRAAPLALLDDGLMDVGNIKGSRGYQLKLFTLVETGAHSELTEHTTTNHLEMRLPVANAVFNVDGEVMVTMHNKIELTVLPGAIRFYVPSKETWERLLGLGASSPAINVHVHLV